MAETVLTIALETVRDLLIEEAKFLLGVRGEVEEIERQLKRMKVFLEYVDAKQVEDKMIQNRVKEIRELADKVEVVLETFAIEVTSKKRRRGVKNALKRYACVFNRGIALHNVGSEIVSIRTQITNLSITLPIFDLGQGQSSYSSNERQERFQTYPHFEEDVVGMEEDIKQLVFQLVNEENKCRVVSICGMGGLGKTTLAKKVYKHSEVQRCFHRFAWVCITQQWQNKDVLQEIFIGLDPDKKEAIMKMSVRELVEKLFEFQQNKKCLVVIDDIWSINAWDSLRPAFPNDQTVHSKVLLTTREKQVALHADPSGFLHEPQYLSDEESWDLLQKRAFLRTDIGTKSVIDPRMEELGRKMVGQCGGLPLAVVVLGGILVLKHTAKDWEMVLQSINTYLRKGEGIGKEDGGVLSVLALSYKNLPYQLKPCFTYLGHFPEDSEIEAEKLYNMWVAEKLVSSEDIREGETMMDVAERYLGELAQRYMVEVRLEEASTARTRFKSCRLHDRMRDLCLSKIKEQNILKVLIVPQGGSSDDSHGNDQESMSLVKQRARHVRSLLLFSGGREFWDKLTGMGINNFKMVRVLVLEGLYFHGVKLPKAIGKMMRLRYLSLKSSWMKSLPSSIGNLEDLQTLDLRTAFVLNVPNVLSKLQQLRHLYLPNALETKKLRLVGLSNLETLVNFHSVYCNVKDLFQMNNLRKLKARIMMEDLGDLVIAITSQLLQHSNIRIDEFSYQSEEEQSIIRKLIGCQHIYKLVLFGRTSGSKLPEHCHFSPSLTKLSLWNLELEDDPMPTLGKLPSLIALQLRCAFHGKEMVCSAISFPQLTSLVLDNLEELKNWRVDEGAFPKLSRVSIRLCKNLKIIPDGFEFITTLKELRIKDMPEEFKNRVRVVNGIEGEDFHKVRHVPSIKFRFRD